MARLDDKGVALRNPALCSDAGQCRQAGRIRYCRRNRKAWRELRRETTIRSLPEDELGVLLVHSAAKPNRRCNLAAISRALDDTRLKRVFSAAIAIEQAATTEVNRGVPASNGKGRLLEAMFILSSTIWAEVTAGQ